MHRSISISRVARLASIVLLALLAASLAFGQQSYVGRYDVYGGYAFFNAPYLNLNSNGFNTQIGFRPSYYYSLGFDYSVGSGDNILGTNVLTNSLQQELATQLGALKGAGIIPANYQLVVPTHLRTQSFEAGIQFAYRHFQAVTMFIRPDLGAIQGLATPHPVDPIQTAVVNQLAPTGRITDWTYFYGFGGGFDFNINKHFSLRVQADLVHNSLFNDTLKNGYNVVRFSVGPGFQFGKNVAEQ